MPCFHPLEKHVDGRGREIFTGKSDTHPDLQGFNYAHDVPCRGCYGCRMRKRLDLTLRGLHEFQDSSGIASFVTFTYRDSAMPDDWSLNKKVASNLTKNLGIKIKRHYGVDVKYIIAGEYGDETDRPHYHAIIFGFNFPDKKPWKRSKNGDMYYTSEFLEEIWPHGFCPIGECNKQTIAYTCKYAMKKVTGELAKEHYFKTNRLTGEQFHVQPEFCNHSWIGKSWFQKYQSDVFPADNIAHEGVLYPVPQYYLDQLEKLDPELWDYVKEQRALTEWDPNAELTVKRLADIEKCKKLQDEKWILERANKV